MSAESDIEHDFPGINDRTAPSLFKALVQLEEFSRRHARSEYKDHPFTEGLVTGTVYALGCLRRHHTEHRLHHVAQNTPDHFRPDSTRYPAECEHLRSIASDPDPEVRAIAIRARDALDELRKLTGVSDIGLHAAWYQLDLALRSE